ncbi:hypothetical protein F5051DRAFT_409906 [Lentinula edodes]|nr:hypothetical protein F5051DRAFT_409906 [Lentinula edodes]
MPSFRSLFLHLLALCIISSTVPNVVASPIALQGGLLEARGVAPSSQAVNAAPDAGPSSNNESWHDHQDDTEDPDPEFIQVPLRIWRTKTKDFKKWIDPTRAVAKGEHWWLCIGKRCYRADSQPTNLRSEVMKDANFLVVDMKLVSDKKDLQNLEKSFSIGCITFYSLEHKNWILRPVQKDKYTHEQTNLEFVEWEIPRWKDANTDSRSDFTNKKFKDLLAQMKAMKNFG